MVISHLDDWKICLEIGNKPTIDLHYYFAIPLVYGKGLFKHQYRMSHFFLHYLCEHDFFMYPHYILLNKGDNKRWRCGGPHQKKDCIIFFNHNHQP